MKQIKKDELYEHFSEFLKTKGIEMKDGSYTQIVQKGCSIMADAVNLTQQGMERAKNEIDKRLDKMRQVIHEKTAPRQQTRPASAEAKPNPPRTAQAAPPRRRAKPSAKIRTRTSGKTNKSKK